MVPLFMTASFNRAAVDTEDSSEAAASFVSDAELSFNSLSDELSSKLLSLEELLSPELFDLFVKRAALFQ